MGLTLLVPGQGNQHATMLERLRDEPAARRVLQEAAEVTGLDMRQELLRRPTSSWYENSFAQPLICTTVLATWQALRDELPVPNLVLGYSVGELAAYGVAGALDVRQTVWLAQQRATAMNEASALESGLLAILGLDKTAVDTLCAEYGAEFAAINGPQHIVVGGTIAALERLRQAARATGAKHTRLLDVRVASHTSLLSGAARRFVLALDTADMQDPQVPLLAGVDASVVKKHEAGAAALSAALCRPLLWSKCMQVAWGTGHEVFLEIGPGRALSRLLRDAYPQAVVRSVEDFASLRATVDWVYQELDVKRTMGEEAPSLELH